MTSDAAVLIGGCVVVPPELLGELHAELVAPRQQVPLDVVQPHRSPQMVALVGTVMDGAIAHRQATRATRESFATLSHSASVPPWESSVDRHAGLSDGEAVSVAFVAEMLGKSHQWVRRLATIGALPGAHKGRGFGNGSGPARICWRIPLASAHAYLQTREVAR
jgi:hypothetical protein